MIDLRTAPYAATVLRISLGAMFIAPVFLIAASLVQALLGDGRLALSSRVNLPQLQGVHA